MADPVGKLVLAVVTDDCPASSCPYRYGDGAGNKKLLDKVEKKLKHRVADGNEVRVLERRVKELEAASKRALDAAEKGRKLNPQEVAHLRNVLQKKGTTAR
jgi:hypothetical protein